MAKKEQKPKVTVEREYIIPLRKEFQKAPSYKRAKKTITAIKEFLTKHMKSDNIKLGKYLNLKVWEHGMKNPPHKVKVKVEKYDDGLVKAELVGAPVEKPKEKKKPAKKTEEKTIKEDKKQTEEKKETAKKEDKKKPEKKQEEKETVKKKEPENKAEEKKEVKEQESKPAETKEELKKQDNKKEEPKEK
jgi:large subunit ribosomal protein L31e